MNNLAFLHGWGMSPQVWDDLIAHLQPILPASKITVYPLPGYAGTPRPAPYSPDKLADEIMAKLPSPVILCGWSMGAMLAMLIASQFPDKVERLILFGATPSFIQREDWLYGMSPDVMTEFEAGFELDKGLALRRFIALFNQNDFHARQISRALSSIQTASLETLMSGLALLRMMDLRDTAGRIHQQSLLIQGEHDPLVPLDAPLWLSQAMPDVKISVLPGTAHAPFLSNPEGCAKLIADFING